MMILQLNPPLPLDYNGRHALAYFILDYSPDHESYFLLAMQDDSTLWWRKQSECRAVVNETLGRVPLPKLGGDIQIGSFVHRTDGKIIP